MSSNDILAELGIEAGVDSPPALDASPNGSPLDITYPTGVVTSLSVTASLSWIVLGMLAFRFRRVWIQYLRDRFEYVLSVRTDLSFRLTYELWVGDEQHSVVMMESSRMPEPLVLEEIAVSTPAIQSSEDELSEVVVLP